MRRLCEDSLGWGVAEWPTSFFYPCARGNRSAVLNLKMEVIGAPPKSVRLVLCCPGCTNSTCAQQNSFLVQVVNEMIVFKQVLILPVYIYFARLYLTSRRNLNDIPVRMMRYLVYSPSMIPASEGQDITNYVTKSLSSKTNPAFLSKALA